MRIVNTQARVVGNNKLAETVTYTWSPVAISRSDKHITWMCHAALLEI